MILHKIDCFGIVNDCRQYLKHINNAFGCNYNGLSEYKHKDEFQRILKLLTLDDVKKAINRSQKIMLKNENSGYTLQSYKGFTYYKENPSLSIWKAVQEILGDCVLI